MSVYDLTVKNNRGEDISLGDYRGKVLLIVNTATRCGLTPQYEGLEALYERYRERGFEILDFPCNQFAFQAPGSDDKIDAFCKSRYDTKFPRFAKIKVNGSDEAPLYTYLKSKKEGRIKWNFTKFLIGADGEVKERFEPTQTPDKIEGTIERELKGSKKQEL